MVSATHSGWLLDGSRSSVPTFCLARPSLLPMKTSRRRFRNVPLRLGTQYRPMAAGLCAP
jgi:hypothetical protein